MPVVRAGRAFDGVRRLDGGAAVFVEDGRIRGVEPATAPVPDGWEVADFPAGTVLPGLIDMHVHLCGDGRNGALDRLAGHTGDELGAVTDRALRDQAAAGVTTVRDLGDRDWTVLERRDRGPEPASRRSSPPARRSPARGATAGRWAARRPARTGCAPRCGSGPSAARTSSRSWAAAAS
ncbi:amidohydrolase family protein [Actinomadura physcomitrii]|uniref:amidohydrolase family protein n=1 Tax=Actinomadura physcomitrii TaxID=2650748 RepID=UPI0019218A7F|nr:amidohydrolase family protein [Actinomadura physcomitrii]